MSNRRTLFGRIRRRRESKTPKPRMTTTADPGEKGINETLELLTFLTIVSKFIADKAKGGFKKRELFGILPLLDDAMGAFEGLEAIPGELADLDADEAVKLSTEVKAALAAHFPEDEDKFDHWIDCAFQLVGPIANLISALKADSADPA